MMEKITFTPNLPVTVRLKYPVGKIVSGNYGEQVYYSTSDGKAMYLDLHVGQMVNELQPKPGEPILIMKKWSGKKTDRPEWHVWRDDGSDPDLVGKLAESHGLARASQIGQQPDGSFRLPAPPKSDGNSREFPSAQTQGATALAPRKPVEPSKAVRTWEDGILAESNALIDVFAAAWKYARERYEGQVKPDEVKTFVCTVYIQSRKMGASHGA